MVLARRGRQLAKKLIALQSFVATVMALIFLLFATSQSALAAMVGSVIAIVPNIVFSAFAFRHAGAQSSSLVMKDFARGIKLKFGLTIIMFAAAFSFFNLPSFPLLMAFSVTVLIQFVAPIFFQQQKLG